MQKVLNVGIGILYLFGACFLFFGISYAQERGIGVRPAKIEIEQGVDWPYTVPITVTNFSVQEERFEVFAPTTKDFSVGVNPGRFMLKAGEGRRVFITFEEPAQGEIRVLSIRAREGLRTGTGVKVPFRVQGADNSRFLAAANQASGTWTYMFGAGILLASLLLLWQIVRIVHSWMNLRKQ